jgi:ornithine cyclodeaminase/alanine dehydrogenase-like protein (mu-crystallin family)
MLHLDDDTVGTLLDPRQCTDALEDAFGEWGRREAASTVRVRASAPAGMASAMAAVVPGLGVSGGKVYATHHGVFTFVIVLFDLEGRLLCTMDGDVLTRVRTPSVSAVAIRHLAAPGSRTAALVGTGRQGLGHGLMLADELDLDELRIAGRDPQAVRALVTSLTDRDVPAVAAADPTAAVTGADVVVTVTAAEAPLFASSAVGERTLICAAGATKAVRRELDGRTIARSPVVVADSVEGSRTECGDLLAAEREGHFSWDRAVELADVVADTVAVPRAGEHGPLVFESQGVALMDIVAAGLVWRAHTGTGTLTPTITHQTAGGAA